MFAFLPITPLSVRPSFSSANVCKNNVKTARRSISMVLMPKETAKVRITGNNITITEALRTHIEEKMGKIQRKFSSVISKIDVHLTVEHNPSVAAAHKAEVVAFAGKTILRTETRSADMYASIDAVEERITRIVKKYKERKSGKSKAKQVEQVTSGVLFDGTDDEEDDQFVDNYATPAPPVPKVNEIVRRKVFPMPLQTVEEAMLCCEYVDHPWYLFRNAASGEISLIYQRNHGGYGLIEPMNESVVDEQPL